MQTDLNQSYQPSSCGPFGISLEDLLRTQSTLNAAFSERAWLDSKLDGCLPRMCFPPPTFPAPNIPGAEGFQYYQTNQCQGKKSYADIVKNDMQKWRH